MGKWIGLEEMGVELHGGEWETGLTLRMMSPSCRLESLPVRFLLLISLMNKRQPKTTPNSSFFLLFVSEIVRTSLGAGNSTRLRIKRLTKDPHFRRTSTAVA